MSTHRFTQDQRVGHLARVYHRSRPDRRHPAIMLRPNLCQNLTAHTHQRSKTLPGLYRLQQTHLGNPKTRQGRQLSGQPIQDLILNADLQLNHLPVLKFGDTEILEVPPKKQRWST